MRKRIITVLLIIAAVTAWIIWDNNRLVVSEYSVEDIRVDKDVRIVQISDFHNRHNMGDKMISKVKEQSPDLIAITGDLVDSNRTDIDYAVQIAGELAEIAPTYYVTGNHEAWISDSDYRKLKNGLTDRGVTVLESGDSIEITDSVRLYGVDDPDLNGDQDVDSTANLKYGLGSVTVDKDKYNILISHRPEAIDAYTSFDLVLTGHAHGGQFRLPFIGGIIAPDQGFLPKYDAGIYEQDGTKMIVSRGVGNSIVPIRINNPSEIIIEKIKPSLGDKS